MSRRLTRLPLLLVLLLSCQVWAIGLGDIALDSALNEPLRAQITLLSASPEELDNLTVALASAETFDRYGIDRPLYLQGVEFDIVTGATGSVINISSRAPITEPFLTFLVEANWSSGRLLREYTVLLDPPTFASPAMQQAPAVTAPVRSTPSDSGRIERQAAPPPPTPAPQTQQRSTRAMPSAGPGSESRPPPHADDAPFSTTSSADLVVDRGQTLWGLATRLRPDSRLSMNQTMLAIYEANPQAFGGNINLLKAGASLRVPSADEIFQISRGAALSEVQRQNSAWGTGDSYVAPAPETGPGFILVPPDEEPVSGDYDDSQVYEPLSREDEIAGRIAELESEDLQDQQSLIQIRDNELASLRQELADIRGEIYEPPPDDSEIADVPDDLASDTADDDLAVDDASIDDILVAEDGDDAVDDAVDSTTEPANVVRTTSSRDKSLVDKILDFLTDWGLIIGAVLVVIGFLIWFMRRGDDDDDSGPWERLDSEDIAAGGMASTAAIQAPVHEDAIVVVEQDSGVHPILEDTVETPAADASSEADGTGSFGSLEDTFSSETAVNLDQTDPIAEADFHMAYGLYDQAADLINGALESDPNDKSLMSKLCEIYFVWGNRDAFVEAATRLKMAVGDTPSGDWDKIVIMGQQIAADDAMFAGAGIAGVSQAVDLPFDEDGGDDAAAGLDMDFGAGADSGASDVIDLGGTTGTEASVDFDFAEPADDLDVTAESPTIESTMSEATAEMPALDSTPTIEEQFAGFDGGTSELPSLDESLSQAITASGQDADATSEINLDDLDLGGVDLDETEVASFDDLDVTGQNESLSDTGINEALVDLNDETGKNPELDPDATGLVEGLDLDLSDDDNSGLHLAADETGQNPSVSAERELDLTDADIDESLLDATGHTQILSEDLAVETAADIGDADATIMSAGLSDDAETMLASLDEDDDDFDFAKTEALPPEAFSGDAEATAGTRAIAATDFDMDLDDLTAALQVSEIGDTIEQPRDDATVEQPRPSMSEDDSEVPTMNLAPEEMSTDLHEARTMTEVGTKLDLARAYVDMGDPAGARSILEEVLDEGDDGQKQQAQQLLDSLPS